MKPLAEVTAEHFHQQFNLNVLGLLLVSQKAVETFDASGGTIINIGSVAGGNPVPGLSVYSATKAAVDAITKSLAKELGARKIRVNSLNPGMVETEGMHAAGFAESDFRKMVEAQTPLGRIGQPGDIGPVAVFPRFRRLRLDHRRDACRVRRQRVRTHFIAARLSLLTHC